MSAGRCSSAGCGVAVERQLPLDIHARKQRAEPYGFGDSNISVKHGHNRPVYGNLERGVAWLNAQMKGAGLSNGPG